MKTIEQLRSLAKNPFYVLTEEEKQALAAADSLSIYSPSDDSKKKSSRGNAAVKETGKLNKHPTDPVND